MRGSGGFPTSDGASHVTSTENGEMLDRFNSCGALGGTAGEGGTAAYGGLHYEADLLNENCLYIYIYTNTFEVKIKSGIPYTHA